MQRVILIYANCENPTAKGDFSLAGNIARDISAELAARTSTNASADKIDVVLTSTMDGIPKFTSLYGSPVNGRVNIEGQSIALCALELFNAGENEVLAYIEANRCKHAPADIVKRVLSADSKILFIGNANQPAITNQSFESFILLSQYATEQPDVYNYFDSDDILLGTCGINNNRLGLTTLKKAEDLPALSLRQASLIPVTDYGFAYLLHRPNMPVIEQMIFAQYMMLTNYNRYVLVGDFVGSESAFTTIYTLGISVFGKSLPNNTVPQITIHSSLDYVLMRRMSARATGNLVASTGVMSTLEALQDGKLPYYQDLSINTHFVNSYLLAIESICSSNILPGTTPIMLGTIVQLSKLLFADKPLRPDDLQRTETLLANKDVSAALITANQLALKKANGTLAPRLLGFIGQPNHTDAQQQLNKICHSLRKPGELHAPDRTQALRRAAAWGRIFELKAIARSMSPAEINNCDTTGQTRTALHWAAIKGSVDCASILISRGAEVNKQDAAGKTALHYAVQAGNRELIRLLVTHGASPDIGDQSGSKPCDNTGSWALSFIQAVIAIQMQAMQPQNTPYHSQTSVSVVKQMP